MKKNILIISLISIIAISLIVLACIFIKDEPATNVNGNPTISGGIVSTTGKNDPQNTNPTATGKNVNSNVPATSANTNTNTNTNTKTSSPSTGASNSNPTSTPTNTQTVQYAVYVDPGKGNDSNNGSIGTPVKTLTKAQEIVRAKTSNMQKDINVYLRGGTYTLSSTLVFNYNDNGKNGHNVIWSAYNNEKVIISGGKIISGWSKHNSSKNIWKASAGGVTSRDFFVNGSRATRARMSGDLSGVSLTSSGFRASSSSMPSSFARPGDLEVTSSGLWQFNRTPISSASVSGGTATFNISSKAWKLLNIGVGVAELRPEYMKYLENAYEFLDQQGEWYLNKDENVIYYIPKSGQDMSSVNSVLGNIEQLIRFDGSSNNVVQNISFKGVTFSNTTWLQASKPEGFCVIQANVYKAASTTENTRWENSSWVTPSSAISGQYVTNISFTNNTFVNLGNGAIHLARATKNCTISSNSISDCASNGIALGSFYNEDHHPIARGVGTTAVNSGMRIVSENNTISNNTINNVCTEYKSGAGIWVGYVARTKVENNTLINLPYTGISFGWGWGFNGQELSDGFYEDNNGKFLFCDNTIKNNYIENIMNVMFDGGGIYTLGRMDNTIIEGNYINKVNNDYGGIYLDNGSSGFTVTNNVVSNCYRNYIYKGNYNYIYNNYTSNGTAKQSDLQMYETFNDDLHYRFDNNYRWNSSEVIKIKSAAGAK